MMINSPVFIRGVGTAAPENCYTQQECWEAFCRSPFPSQLSSRSQAIVRKVLCGDSGIKTRHLAMANLEEAYKIDPNTLHERFAKNAPVVAANAARRAMASWQSARVGLVELVPPVDKIDALLISTCTGYVCPGLTSYVSELLGLRPNILLLDFVGQGCGAALPNMQTAAALIASEQAENVLCICVEICSAAFFIDNDPGVLISACLFGDGAGAVVLSNEPGEGRAILWEHFATILNPRDRELLRFEQRDGMLRNVLDKSIPLLVVEHVQQVFAELQKLTGIEKSGIAEWILHAGGRDVLAAIQTGFGLSADQLRWSAQVLRDFGNISSPSIIFALENALRANAPGGKWFLSSFGAGISCHGALLDVQ
jgi:predicted naringenin-chalcone synthase